MGDRICINILDKDRCSPTLYCHWAGLRALKAMHDALPESRPEIQNIMCNLIIKVMGGNCSDASFYLYNKDECKTSADHDNWFWSFHIDTKTWTTTDPKFDNKRMTIEEVEKYIKERRPCLYRECPCEHYGEQYCNLRMHEMMEKSKKRREGYQ